MSSDHEAPNEQPANSAHRPNPRVSALAKSPDMTGISAFTLRYYDKCGFFPGLARDKRGVRSFSHADIAQLHLIEALRKSGLSIEGIQYYVRLAKRGPSTAGERLTILQERETALAYQRTRSSCRSAACMPRPWIYR